MPAAATPYHSQLHPWEDRDVHPCPQKKDHDETLGDSLAPACPPGGPGGPKGARCAYKDTDKVLWALRNISGSSGNMKQCLWLAMQEYNKDSRDKFLFQVVKVWQVQMQVRALSSQFAFCSCLPLAAQTETRMRGRVARSSTGTQWC